jgi:hypothetical protein
MLLPLKKLTTMKIYILILFSLVIFPINLSAKAKIDAGSIDKQLVKIVDVTGNGKQDKIILHLKAKNIKAPFLWTLTIMSEGKPIYSYSSDDTWLNGFFESVNYVGDCKDYISCKKKYYYHDILNGIVETDNKSTDVEGILDKSVSNTLYPLGQEQLKECCNITGEQAELILKKLEAKFRSGKAITVNIPVSPVEGHPPLIFVPEIG